ncbi:MAG: helix-turn-helix domain-containing protein [Silicimonas sp.]|nr:helix-turn-helix domain-containing protein [Silicimonas sp.]
MAPETLSDSLGQDLRVLRKSRGLTLSEVAAKVGRSVGWLSQVERDISEPSMEELGALAEVLGVSVSSFFGKRPSEPREEGRVVRAGARRPLSPRVEGLSEELLSPDLTDDFEVIHSTFAPGSSREETISRPTQEVGFIVSGRLELTIDGETYHLTPGDSFRLRGEAYRWRNPHYEPCIVVWVIAPPVY